MLENEFNDHVHSKRDELAIEAANGVKGAKNALDFVDGSVPYYDESNQYFKRQTALYLKKYQATPLYKFEKAKEKGAAFIDKLFKKNK